MPIAKAVEQSLERTFRLQKMLQSQKLDEEKQ